MPQTGVLKEKGAQGRRWGRSGYSSVVDPGTWTADGRGDPGGTAD